MNGGIIFFCAWVATFVFIYLGFLGDYIEDGFQFVVILLLSAIFLRLK